MGVKNLLMYRLDQKTDKERTIIFPPLTIPDAIQWLDNYYGSYKNGSMIYFGMTRSYMIPFGGCTKVFKDNERKFVSIIVPKIGGKMTDNICQLSRYGDNSKYYIIADPQSFEPRDEMTTTSVTKEDEVVSVDPTTGNSSGSSGSNPKYVTKKGYNPYIEHIYKAQLKSGKSVIQVFFKDINMGIITPNKIYQFLFEDTSLSSKYKGRYFLCSREINITKESKDYTIGMICEFRKFLDSAP